MVPDPASDPDSDLDPDPTSGFLLKAVIYFRIPAVMIRLPGFF